MTEPRAASSNGSPCVNEMHGMVESWAPRTSICDRRRKARENAGTSRLIFQQNGPYGDR